MTVERFADRVVAITGAGSGIGRALAVETAARGAHLALADLDEAGLGETAARCEGLGTKITTRVVDVAHRPAVFDWAETVVAEHGRANVIVNNAGVALVATVEAGPIEDVEWLIGVNLWGVINGTQAFLPHLKAAGEGHVVNVSSVFGLLALPTQSAYSAAKFGVRAFTDALRLELALEDSPVSATTVHPGGIRTGIARSARIHPSAAALTGPTDTASSFDRVARTTPEKAARRIVEGVARDRPRVLIGPDARLVDLFARLPAGLQQRLLAQGVRRRH